MVTVVAAPPRAGGAPGPSQLVELKVVDGDYPFYGKLEARAAPAAAPSCWRPTPRWSPPSCSPRLGLPVGDTLRIGGRDFRIAGAVLAEPDRLEHLADPRPAGLPLRRRASRAPASWDAAAASSTGSCVKLPDGEAPGGVAVAAALLRRAAGAAYVRVETYKEAQPDAARERSATSSASSAWWPCSRSSSAASAWRRACAPGSPGGSTRSRS